MSAAEHEGTIKVVRDGTLLLLVMERPKRKNALTREMYSSLADALEEAKADPGVRVVVITGAGEAFTAGNDLSDFLAAPPEDTDAPVFRFLLTLVGFPKPLVAAVDGVAVGIGTTMLLHCDLVYASNRAKLSMPFSKLGLTPEGASSLLLPAMMGHLKAAELLYFGDAIDAETAERLGLVNAVVAPERLLETTLDRASELARRPPAAIAAAKELLRRSTLEAVQETLLNEAEVFISRLGSDEAKAAMEAFFKR